MGTPREYGFNDILKENILKADPVSFSAFVLIHGGPLFSRHVDLRQQEKGWGVGPWHKFKKPQKPTVWFWRLDPATQA